MNRRLRRKAKGKRQKAKMERVGKLQSGLLLPLLPFGFCRRARKRITRYILPYFPTYSQCQGS